MDEQEVFIGEAIIVVACSNFRKLIVVDDWSGLVLHKCLSFLLPRHAAVKTVRSSKGWNLMHLCRHLPTSFQGLAWSSSSVPLGFTSNIRKLQPFVPPHTIQQRPVVVRLGCCQISEMQRALKIASQIAFDYNRCSMNAIDQLEQLETPHQRWFGYFEEDVGKLVVDPVAYCLAC